MGLLTNPEISRKTSYLKHLISFNRFVCFIFYLAGVIHFCLLPDNNLNSGTYFSENALLPGLVYSEIKWDTVSVLKSLQYELEHERETHRNSIPYAWLLAKMKKIGLETNTHNFTLNYPLGGGKVFTGKNVYGILRAPRIGSTESIVVSVPYRPPDSILPEISSGVPLILAFADFARKQKYWAKDIIFIITEQEQLGMQAWLEAYHGYDDNSVLNSGNLDARAGAIQAAINLEVQGLDVDYINIKIEGLNGQLPNLDLHNLVQKLSSNQGISAAYKLKNANIKRGQKHFTKLMNMISMILTQTSGVPTGNHGLFHKYGIEALTLECVKKSSSNYKKTQNGINALLRIVEGICRSLNNLLERFHQSFFFYIMVSHDRFVSIGDYMISLGLMVGSLFIKSFILWLALNRKDDKEQKDDKNDEKHEEKDNYDKTDDECKKDNKEEIDEKSREDEKLKKDKLQIQTPINYLHIGILIFEAHIIGVMMAYLPLSAYLDNYFHSINVPTHQALFLIVLCISIISMFMPLGSSLNEVEVELLHIAVLLEHATALLAVGILNISLGMFVAVFTVPLVIVINPKHSLFKKTIIRTIWSLVQPLSCVCCVVTVLTFSTFPELSAYDLLNKALSATIDGITFSIVDSMIYGNWLFNIVSLVFFPTWILFWTVQFPTKRVIEQTSVKLKTS